MRTLLLIILSFTTLQALSFEGMMKIVKHKSHDITLLERNIQQAKYNLQLASKWENPTLSVGMNDIQLRDMSNRSLEAMQTQYITLSQTIPTNSKLSIAMKIAAHDRTIKAYLLQDKILQLRALLHEYLAQRMIVLKKLALIKEYKANITQLQKLYAQLTKVNSSSHFRAIESDIALSRLKIQEQSLQSTLKILHLQIEKLLYQKVRKISFTPMRLGKLRISTHPFILAQKAKIHQDSSRVEMAKAKKIPNIKLNLGYFNRTDREDYLSVSASMPLPIYGREEIEVEKAKLARLQRYDELEIAQNTMQATMKILKTTMHSSYANYKRIQKEIVGHKKYLQKLLGGQIVPSEVDSSMVISSINAAIAEELLALDELSRYYSAYSQLTYFKAK